jgi:hypothetical protein
MGLGTEDAPMPQKKAGWHHGVKWFVFRPCDMAIVNEFIAKDKRNLFTVINIHATRDSMAIVNEFIAKDKGGHKRRHFCSLHPPSTRHFWRF